MRNGRNLPITDIVGYKMKTSAAVHHLKQETETPQMIGVGHVALSARDPVALAEFYRNALGLQVVPTETVRSRRERFPQQPPGRRVGRPGALR